MTGSPMALYESADPNGTARPTVMNGALARDFAPDKIKQKRGQGGRTMTYISHGLITERLNDAAPGWSSTILQTYTTTDANGRLHCEGIELALTIDGVTRVEAGGPQRQDGFANELKNAYSDALKRAAMRFGVALRMWENLVDAEYDEDAHPGELVPTRPVRPGSGEPASADRTALMRRLHGAGGAVGWTHDVLHAMAIAKGYGHVTDVPTDHLEQLIQWFTRAPDKARAAVANYTTASVPTATLPDGDPHRDDDDGESVDPETGEVLPAAFAPVDQALMDIGADDDAPRGNPDRFTS